jgi:hypothetical protein
MSWSVSATGKAAAVAAKVAADLSKIKCAEPEETIKNAVGSAIAAGLAVFPPDVPVKVSASGSQSDRGSGQLTNQLSVDMQPIWGFIE